jgi:hypothetical protein
MLHSFKEFERSQKNPTMPLLSRPTPPHQPSSLQQQLQHSGLSLLDDDSLSNEPPPSESTAAASTNKNRDVSHALSSLGSSSRRNNTIGPYDYILEQAQISKIELETVRDDLYWLQVQNCRTLDALCMVGAALNDDAINDMDHVGAD